MLPRRETSSLLSRNGGLSLNKGMQTPQFSLGFMYEKGQGVPQNYKTAVKWYTLAAEQGDAGAPVQSGFYVRHRTRLRGCVASHHHYNEYCHERNRQSVLGTSNNRFGIEETFACFYGTPIRPEL